MMMHDQSRRCPNSRDSGFTLVELLIVMMVLGVVTTAIAGATIVALRTTPPTEVRADDARSMLGLVTWLPQDVDSTPPNGFDQVPGRASDCSSSPGTNILHLTWTEQQAGGIVTFIANYRYVTSGSKTSLRRVTCSGLGSPPYTNTVDQNLTSDLPPLPSGWTPGNPPVDVFIDRNTTTNEVRLVTFEITTKNGAVVKSDSAPKNPAETLPTTTLPSWYIPTPTTAVYSNSDPVAPDYTIDAYPAPQLTSVVLAVSDPDGDSLIVNLDWSTVPAGWLVNLVSTTLTVSPSLLDVGTSHVIEYEVDDNNGGTDDGEVTVNVISVATPTTTSTTTTTVPAATTTTLLPICAVLSTSVNPASIKNVQPNNNGSTNVGVLFQSVTVSATTNGYCTGMEIRYNSGGVNSPPFVNMTQTGPTTWVVTLSGKDAGSSETWSDGSHAITFHSSTGGPWATNFLTVT